MNRRLARSRRAATLAVVAAFVATAASGCATSSGGGTAPAGSDLAAVQRLHDELPAALRAGGTLRIVTDASYAPASSFAADGRTIVGFEPDLGKALGEVLGVAVKFEDNNFSKLPALVRSGRADLIMSAMTDTRDREAGLDFVDYFSAGTSIVVQRGNPQGITDLTSLCGQRVAVQSGTVQADLLGREQQHCGSSPIRLLTAQTNDDALLMVRTGRAAALPMDYPPAELLTTDERTRAQYQLASTEQYEPGPYGIGVAKDHAALRTAVRDALSLLMRNGSYQAVLAKWHVSSGALHGVSVNAAGGTVAK